MPSAASRKFGVENARGCVKLGGAVSSYGDHGERCGHARSEDLPKGYIGNLRLFLSTFAPCSLNLDPPMDRPRFQKTQGIVLKNLPLGEADRLLTLYTPHHGKVRAVAKGVRRVKSHLGGHLEPLVCAEVLIAKGRGALDVISQAETVASHARLRGDLWRTTCGIYATELVDQFGGEGLENLGLYGLLRDTLARLSEDHSPPIVLRYFEMQLLILTGFQPELYSCLACNVTLSPTTNSFSPALGGVLCPACRRSDPLARPLSLNALKVLRLLARGSFETASKVRLETDLALEVEHTLRQYMRHLLEKDLKSTDFLDILRREESDAPAFTPTR